MNAFEQAIANSGAKLKRDRTEILQLNVGRLCNLTCMHCHVGAGPRRKEIITRDTVDRILDWFEASDIPVLDLTGGTPEMIPDFQYLIERVRRFERPRHIMDRLNPTIFYEPGFDWVPEFLAENEIEIVASMPCYEPENVEAQRGKGVFDKSIAAFQKLNELGYGNGHPRKQLNLVYNPNGAKLPPPQDELEYDYKVALQNHFGIEFDHLFALANLPITRFASYLRRQNAYESYIIMLKEAFNPATVQGLMCRNTLNVSWKGEIYDCDFNQMMNLPLREKQEDPLYLWDIDLDTLYNMPIRTANHCFGCTAGTGSSCTGALAQKETTAAS